MLVIARRYGQLGNRLFLFAHLIAAAEHYGVELRNPCFSEYADLFPSTRQDLWCRYLGGSPSNAAGRIGNDGSHPTRRQRNAVSHAVEITTKALYLSGLRRVPCQVIRLAKDESCDLLGDRFGDAIRCGRPVLLQGWRFRSDQLLMQHWARIRDFFKLDDVSQTHVNSSVTAARQGCDVLVGVHIRRGDYANFMGGRYYFDDACYARWMWEIQEQYPGRRVRFLVCSNETLDEKCFEGLSLSRGPGSAVGDLYALAETDLMIGPPSTFTGWAGFIGQKPRIELDSQAASVAVPSPCDGSRLARVAC
ncbi:alpha-1,2-fucosyltransferase [Rhodopirellula sp. MGV]|uniref:alpha-1,2-fucosyltransferase n=1 Tax=Rhodopirellula sp. MGV TaxID=2023130 RepID=UPI000B96915E|nr:alpha-1,2-fucosyltransferase [Rhodopirellula sp. MGV]OYP36585.1 hypothetical protein CGZ80_08120 [Rhodopirellula sp. MGV]PNY34562.1 hypothetical protein C2E31_22935 [Rhodopirellula baltica]